MDLLAEMSDHVNVFGEKEMDRLPLHQHYDCPIDLVLNAKLLVGWIYLLSEPVLVVLRDFIDKNLQKKFTNYYCKFVSHFATLTVPLSNLLKKEVKFH